MRNLFKVAIVSALLITAFGQEANARTEVFYGVRYDNGKHYNRGHDRGYHDRGRHYGHDKWRYRNYDHRHWNRVSFYNVYNPRPYFREVYLSNYYVPSPRYVNVQQISYNGASAEQDYCREYQAIAMVGGARQETYGTACLRPDGSWEIMN